MHETPDTAVDDQARGEQPSAERRRFGGILRQADFRRLWLAGAVSQFGSEITVLAIPLIAVLTLDAGPIAMGVLGASGSAPALLFGLIAGVWADRLRRRRVMVASDLARAAILVSIPVAWWLGALSMPYLAVAAFVVGTFTVFFDVAHASYLPSLLRRDELVEANSKIEISESLTQLAGPGLGGLLIQLMTAPIAIAIDAVSFVISALFVGRIRTSEPRPAREAKSAGVLAEAAEGLRVVGAHPLLRATTAYAASAQLMFGAVLAMYVLFAVESLGLQPAEIGVAGMAAAPGTMLGAVVVARAHRRIGLGPTMAAAAVTSSAGLGLMPLASSVPAAPLAVLALAWFLLGLVGAVYDISEVSLRQAVTPDHLRGRVNATRYFAFFGVGPIGALIGGFLGAAIGPRSAMMLGAAGLLVASLWILVTPVRRLSEPPPSFT
jgi:MFS family permease